MRMLTYGTPLVAASIYCSCGTFTTQTQSTIRQSGIVPGATAPMIPGSGPDAGKFSLSASAQGGLRGAGSGGAGGSLVADTGGRLSMGYSGNWWGLAAGLDVRPRAWMHGGPNEATPTAFADELVFMPTLATRFRPVNTELFELGLVVELSVASVPFVRDIETSTVTTSSSGTSNPWGSRSADVGRTALVVFRTGPTFSWKLGHGIALSTGFLIANQPYFEAETVVSRTCTTSGWNTDCSGSTADDVPVVSNAIALVPFFSPSVTFGHVQIIGQFFGNFSSNPQLMETAPGGGELQARFLF